MGAAVGGVSVNDRVDVDCIRPVPENQTSKGGRRNPLKKIGKLWVRKKESLFLFTPSNCIRCCVALSAIANCEGGRRRFFFSPIGTLYSLFLCASWVAISKNTQGNEPDRSQDLFQ